jgi:hypothetical protein
MHFDQKHRPGCTTHHGKSEAERRGEERRGEKRGEEGRGAERRGGELRGEEAGTIGKHLARGVLARRIADLGGAAPQ